MSRRKGVAVDGRINDVDRAKRIRHQAINHDIDVCLAKVEIGPTVYTSELNYRLYI